MPPTPAARLAALEEQLLSSGSNDWRLCRDVLKLLRETKTRQADLVLKCFSVLRRYRSKLGDEAWSIYEQAAIAWMDAGHTEKAKTQGVYLLRQQFPQSQRVRRLQGMSLECDKKWDDALEIYEKALEHDTTNPRVLKRRIAIWKGEGDIPQAIEALCKYLQIFAVDSEAWLELATLYLSLQQYASAAFCFEELILISPQNPMLHAKYADVLFTQGGDYKTARKYYAQSLVLKPQGNLRAVYGLLMCCQALSSKAGKSREDAGKENADLEDWAKAQLALAYKPGPAALFDIVKRTFDLKTIV